jgi:signal transduction histidine kinase
MKLRTKTFLIIFSLFSTLMGSLYFVTRNYLLEGFEKVEAVDAENKALRVTDAVTTLTEGLSTKSADWGAWDDAYYFVQNKNKKFVESNFAENALYNLNISALAYFDASGKAVQLSMYDLENKKQVPFSDSLLDLIQNKSDLLKHDQALMVKTGILNLPEGFMIFATRAVINSEMNLPIKGSVFFGRYLSSSSVTKIAQMTNQNIVQIPFYMMNEKSDLKKVLPLFKKIDLPSTKSISIPYDKKIIHGYALIYDYFGKPAVIYRTQIERVIYNEGLSSLNIINGFIFIAGIFIGLLLVLAIDRTVVSRLVDMADEVGQIDEHKIARIQIQGRDEIGILCQKINAMLNSIEDGKKLTDAFESARAATALKSQFLANMSHELRTPMNGVLGMASVLAETPLDDEQKDCVESIVNSGQSMLSLINNILDLSKIEAGIISIDNSPLQLQKIIDEVADLVHLSMKKKKLSWMVNSSPVYNLWHKGDSDRLKQVLLNFVGNAIKFTAKGFVRLDVETVDSTDSTDTLRFVIQDSGIGMSEDTLKKIFNPFVQGDSSSTKQFEGTGLGLSICKKIVDSFGGQIGVKSYPQEGTIIWFEITLEKYIFENNTTHENKKMT